jgi:hypothetical protein
MGCPNSRQIDELFKSMLSWSTSLQRLDSFGRKLGTFESRNDLNVWSKTSCLLHLL